MLKNMLATWLPPMFLVTTAFGVGLNLLAPDAPQLSNPSTAMASTDAASSDFTLNFAVDGTFWAPFWGIFDMYYDPHDIAAMESAAVLTPVFTWFYLLVALVLFVNLLIAMFNAECAPARPPRSLFSLLQPAIPHPRLTRKSLPAPF